MIKQIILIIITEILNKPQTYLYFKFTQLLKGYNIILKLNKLSIYT